MSSEELSKLLQERIETEEKKLAEMFGMKLHTSDNGFLPSQIYEYVGRDDGVATLTFLPGSESLKEYGQELTVTFIYEPKERQALENDHKVFDDNPKVKARELLNAISEEKHSILSTKGIDTRDICKMTVGIGTKKNNTFYSKKNRTPNVLEIPFEAEGNGKDIYWMYGFLEDMKEKGIALTHDEEAQRLAYKIILAKEELSNEEYSIIFYSENKITNKDVAYYFLQWKKEAGILRESEKPILNSIIKERFCTKIGMLDDELKKMGLTTEKFMKTYPDKFSLILKKIFNFHEQRYNDNGKHLLYMNFQTFLHIYLRHVEELKVHNQFEDRTKFQLKEKDVMTVMDIVMRALNEEYQKFKDEHPNGRFFKAGKMAYYYNGDYYCVDVVPDGRISTFYKYEGKPKETHN